MTLFFRSDNPAMIQRRDQFLRLCKRWGIHGVAKREGNHWIVRPQCRNVTEERKLTAAWSNETCEIEDGPASTPSLFGRGASRK